MYLVSYQGEIVGCGKSSPQHLLWTKHKRMRQIDYISLQIHRLVKLLPVIVSKKTDALSCLALNMARYMTLVPSPSP